jgi:hypothetical protein
MSHPFRILVWTAAVAFVLALCALVSSLPHDGSVRAKVRAAPPEIVMSPRLGHYDPGAGHYVWWR